MDADHLDFFKDIDEMCIRDSADSVQDLMAQARHLALFDFPILIQGESGTQRRTLALSLIHISAGIAIGIPPLFRTDSI